MAEGDTCLLDSNILLRISKSDDAQHPVIVRALKTLVGQGIRLCYTSQPSLSFGTPLRVLLRGTALA